VTDPLIRIHIITLYANPTVPLIRRSLPYKVIGRRRLPVAEPQRLFPRTLPDDGTTMLDRSLPSLYFEPEARGGEYDEVGDASGRGTSIGGQMSEW